jgi:hypothetical protein
MRARLCTVLSFLFLTVLPFSPAAFAQDALTLPGAAGSSLLKPEAPAPKGRTSGLLNEELVQNEKDAEAILERDLAAYPDFVFHADLAAIHKIDHDAVLLFLLFENLKAQFESETSADRRQQLLATAREWAFQDDALEVFCLLDRFLLDHSGADYATLPARKRQLEKDLARCETADGSARLRHDSDMQPRQWVHRRTKYALEHFGEGEDARKKLRDYDTSLKYKKNHFYTLVPDKERERVFRMVPSLDDDAKNDLDVSLFPLFHRYEYPEGATDAVRVIPDLKEIESWRRKNHFEKDVMTELFTEIIREHVSVRRDRYNSYAPEGYECAVFGIRGYPPPGGEFLNLLRDCARARALKLPVVFDSFFHVYPDWFLHDGDVRAVAMKTRLDEFQPEQYLFDDLKKQFESETDAVRREKILDWIRQRALADDGLFEDFCELDRFLLDHCGEEYAASPERKRRLKRDLERYEDMGRRNWMYRRTKYALEHFGEGEDARKTLRDLDTNPAYRTRAYDVALEEKEGRKQPIELPAELAGRVIVKQASKVEAVIAPTNVILCSVPEKATVELETKRLYQRADRPSEPIRVQEGGRTRLIPAEWKDDVTEIPGKVRLTISPLRSSKYALTSTIRSTYERAYSSTRPSSWNFDCAVETPFDFSFNYMPGKQMSLTASYFNAAISILMQDQDLKRPLPQSELEPAFSFARMLFHGYESQSDVKQVEYFDLKPEAVKLVADQTGTVFKIDCPYREAYRDLKNEFYVLAVADKGELSVEKAYYHFGRPDSVPANFVSTDYYSGEKTERKTFFYHIADSGEATAYPALADIPDTVFLTLPEGETSAEVTFYFISKDGAQYAAQKVELNVPEGTEPRTISSKPTVYDIQGEIYGTGNKPLDKVGMNVEFLDASDPERGATDREIATFDSAFRLILFGYPKTQLKLTFSHDGYVSSSQLVTPEELRAEQENNRSRSRASELFDRDTDASDREIVLKKKINHTMVNLPADMIVLSGELKYDPANNTRIVCDLSEVEQGKAQLKTTDMETPPGSRYLEFKILYSQITPFDLNIPPDRLLLNVPRLAAVYYRSEEENAGFRSIQNYGIPEKNPYTFENYLDRDKTAPEDWYLDGARELQMNYGGESISFALRNKPYILSLLDRIRRETGADIRTPDESYFNSSRVAASPEVFAFLKCGKHYGKIGIRNVRVEFNPDDPKKSTATLEFELHINKAENDRNLTVR